jgi:hypothetical protein
MHMKSQRVTCKKLLVQLPISVALVAGLYLILPYINSLPSALAEVTGLDIFYHAYSESGMIVFYFVLSVALGTTVICTIKIFEMVSGRKILKNKEERKEIKRKIDYVELKLSWFTKILISSVILIIAIPVYIGITST